MCYLKDAIEKSELYDKYDQEVSDLESQGTLSDNELNLLKKARI